MGVTRNRTQHRAIVSTQFLTIGDNVPNIDDDLARILVTGNIEETIRLDARYSKVLCLVGYPVFYSIFTPLNFFFCAIAWQTLLSQQAYRVRAEEGAEQSESRRRRKSGEGSSIDSLLRRQFICFEFECNIIPLANVSGVSARPCRYDTTTDRAGLLLPVIRLRR